MKNELMKMLGYHLYTFRWENKLTETEMLELLTDLMETKQFKKEYGMEEE